MQYVGFFGYVLSGAEVKNMGVRNSSFQGKGRVAAVAGILNASSMNNVYSKNNTVSGTAAIVGGLIGYAYGSDVKYSYSYNDVVSTNVSDVGGLIGYSYNGSVTDSYAMFDTAPSGANAGSGDAFCLKCQKN